jgi:hypothetical protein
MVDKEKRFFMNKKAQGLSTSTIILIVLGLIVLVVLVIGVSMGWANVKEWIAPSSNVDDIVQQCNIACSTDQKYTFCTQPRELKTTGEDPIEDTTCYALAERRSVYGIEKCRLLDCDVFQNLENATATCIRLEQVVQHLDPIDPKVFSTPCTQDHLNFNAANRP